MIWGKVKKCGAVAVVVAGATWAGGSRAADVGTAVGRTVVTSDVTLATEVEKGPDLWDWAHKGTYVFKVRCRSSEGTTLTDWSGGKMSSAKVDMSGSSGYQGVYNWPEVTDSKKSLHLAPADDEGWYTRWGYNISGIHYLKALSPGEATPWLRIVIRDHSKVEPGRYTGWVQCSFWHD